MEKLLVAAKFEPLAFLDAVKAFEQAQAQEAEASKLKWQREEEETQRHKWAVEKARELLKGEFEVAQRNLGELGERLKRRDARISELKGYLEKLIRRSNDTALIAAGLVQSQAADEDEQEELDPAVQEALQTAGLADC